MIWLHICLLALLLGLGSSEENVLQYNEEVVLTCDHGALQGKPALTWFHNEIKMIIHEDLYLQNDDNQTLTILKARAGDEGTYKCEFTLDGQPPASRTVELYAPPIVGKFSKKSENKVEGESAEFVCKAWGRPDPTITWMRKNDTYDESDYGEVIPTDGDDSKYEFRRTADTQPENNVLVIKDLKYADYGDYMCLALNEHGNASITILLRVKDKLGALWPFLGICLEVAVLCIIIFVYEHRRAKRLESEEAADAAAENLTNNDHKGSAELRHRKA